MRLEKKKKTKHHHQQPLSSVPTANTHSRNLTVLWLLGQPGFTAELELRLGQVKMEPVKNGHNHSERNAKTDCCSTRTSNQHLTLPTHQSIVSQVMAGHNIKCQARVSVQKCWFSLGKTS